MAGIPMMGMMGGPPPALLQKKKEEEALRTGVKPGSVDHSALRLRAKGPRTFLKLFSSFLMVSRGAQASHQNWMRRRNPSIKNERIWSKR